MNKNIFLLLALFSAVFFASSTACNDNKSEKVASHKIVEKTDDNAENLKTADSTTAKTANNQSGKIQVVVGEEPENIKKCPKVLISTSFGDMKVALYNSTPGHRDNFLKLVEEGFYNDLLFHRIIQGFMIQGGDPNSKDAAAGARLGSGGPGYTIPAEFNTQNVHKKGALAAARTGNPEKKSSGSQFYIVQGRVESDASLDAREQAIRRMYPETADFAYTPEQREAYKTVGGTSGLDMDYTVFGEVVEGMDVLDKIAAVQKDRADRPVEDVKMTIVKAKK